MSPTGGHHSGPIPVVEYSIVDPGALIPPRCDNSQAIAFGFNDGQEWKLGSSNSNSNDNITTVAGAITANNAAEDEDGGRFIRFLRE